MKFSFNVTLSADCLAAGGCNSTDTPPLLAPSWLQVLGQQANLKESSKSNELAEMRLQVLVVVITSGACESKKEIIRLRE